MKIRLILFLLVPSMLLAFCKNSSSGQKVLTAATEAASVREIPEDSIVYQSEHMVIHRLSEHVYQHISFLQTNDWGKVECNGMLVVSGGEGIVFDTPADEKSSEELLQFSKALHCKIKAVVPTHFHADCVAGLSVFKKQQIPAYASNRTIAFLRTKADPDVKYLQGFDDSLELSVNGSPVYTCFFGEGHTRDNVVGYFPQDRAVFGGCLVKEVNASKGNLEDANVAAWSATVKKVKAAYPQPMIVIPGHGKWGGGELLDYTIKLFQ